MSIAVIRNGKLVRLSVDEGAKYTAKLLRQGKIRYNSKIKSWDSNNGKGWVGESERHRMAGYGLKSGSKRKISDAKMWKSIDNASWKKIDKERKGGLYE